MKIEKTQDKKRGTSGVPGMIETLLKLADDGSECLRLTTAAEALNLIQARANIDSHIFKTRRDGGDVLVWKTPRAKQLPTGATYKNRPQY